MRYSEQLFRLAGALAAALSLGYHAAGIELGFNASGASRCTREHC